MKIALIIGIVVILFAIIIAVLLLLKRRNSEKTTQYPQQQTPTGLPRTLGQQGTVTPPQVSPMMPPTLHQTQPNMPTMGQSQPIQQPQQPDPNMVINTYMAQAQQLINQQNYKPAITVLKNAVKANPKRSDTLLLLLNTLALTKDHKGFNQLYPHLMRLNDPNAQIQATNLKNMLEQELIIQQQQQHNQMQARQAMQQPVVPQPQPTMPAMQPPVPQATQPSTVQPLAGDLDFNFDVPPAPAPVATPTAVQPANNQSLDFDFDIPTPTTTATATQPVKNESLDFDFETPTPPSVSEPVAVTQTQSAPVVKNDSLDFDFDVNPTPTSTPTITEPASLTTPAPTVMEDTGFEFNLATPAQTPVEQVQPTPTVSTDEFNFDFELPSTKTPTSVETEAVQPTSVATPTPTADDFNFDFDLPSTQTPAPVEVEAVQPTPVATPTPTTDDFSFELPETQTPVEAIQSTPTSTDNTPEFSFDSLEFNQPEPEGSVVDTVVTPNAPTPSTPSIPQSTITAPVVGDLSLAFNFFDRLDSAEINVELAEQYIELGEYDSAKRLLEETGTTNNIILDQRITKLLTKFK